MMEIIAIFMYLVRMLAIGTATGTVFLQYGLFPGVGRGQVVFLGLCVSPMIASMMSYLLGLVFIGWPSWFFYAIPLTLAIVWLMQGVNRALLQSVCRDGWAELRNAISSLGKWGIVDFAVALGFVGILAICFSIPRPPGWKEIIATHATSLARAKFVGIGFILWGLFWTWQHCEQLQKKQTLLHHLFFIAFLATIGSALLAGFLYQSHPMIGSDQSHYELNARYYLEDKNSWAIDNYSDDRYGSSLRDDHGPLWIVALADPRIALDMVGGGDVLQVSNFNLLWIYLCFNGMLILLAFWIAGNIKASIMTLLLFGMNLYEKIFLLLGSRDAFRFIGLLFLFLYLGKIFSVIVEGHTSWKQYGFMAFCCWMSLNGKVLPLSRTILIW